MLLNTLQGLTLISTIICLYKVHLIQTQFPDLDRRESKNFLKRLLHDLHW